MKFYGLFCHNLREVCFHYLNTNAIFYGLNFDKKKTSVVQTDEVGQTMSFVIFTNVKRYQMRDFKSQIGEWQVDKT